MRKLDTSDSVEVATGDGKYSTKRYPFGYSGYAMFCILVYFLKLKDELNSSSTFCVFQHTGTMIIHDMYLIVSVFCIYNLLYCLYLSVFRRFNMVSFVHG